MKKFRHIFIASYVMIFLITAATTYTSSEYFEPRTEREQILTSGIIPITLFVLPFSLIIVYGLHLLVIQKRILFGIIVSIVGYYIISVLGFFLLLGYSEIGIFKKDRIIYYLPSDTTKKIILQFYETGVTGNERYRLIETNAIDASLRPIKEIKTQNNVLSLIKQGCLGYGCSQVDTTKVPKIIEYQNEDYRFERVCND
jgi:hypothetical protein